MKKWVRTIIACLMVIGIALLVRQWALGNNTGLDEIEFLLDDPSYSTNLGMQLIDAVIEGDTESATALLEQGADVNTVGIFGGPPLVTAVMADKIELIPLLLDHGADVSVKSHDGYTAYEYAQQFYNDPLLNNLLSLPAGP